MLLKDWILYAVENFPVIFFYNQALDLSYLSQTVKRIVTHQEMIIYQLLEFY